MVENTFIEFGIIINEGVVDNLQDMGGVVVAQIGHGIDVGVFDLLEQGLHPLDLVVDVAHLVPEFKFNIYIISVI